MSLPQETEERIIIGRNIAAWKKGMGIKMNTGFIIGYLRDKFGCRLPDGSWQQATGVWEQWYRGEVDGFHDTVVNNGIISAKRQLFRLNMAKRVAEDWADLLLNEKTDIVLSDRRASEFLFGADGNGGVMGDNDFRVRANRLIEKTFALGTGAMTVYLENALLDKNGRLLPSPDAVIRLDTVDARGIFPISWQDDRISDVCFAGELNENGEKRLYLQIHKLTGEGYVIYSRYFRHGETGLEETALPPGVAPEVKTGSKVPWFAIFRPNSVNHLFPELPVGLSVFADSTDILKGIDLCYDSFNMEFWLGRKMVFLRKDLLARDSAGNIFAPQDLNKQLFMYVGDKTVDGDMLPKEFNPALRVSEHIEALNEQLSCLSVKCGLGENRYRFETGNRTVRTATQVVSDNAALFRSVKKHEAVIEKSLITVVRAILSLAGLIDPGISGDTGISVVFDDSVIEDKAAEQTRDLELIKAGVMLPWEFRVKHRGEDAETAKAMLS